MPALAGSVTIHAITMFLKSDQSTDLAFLSVAVDRPYAHPTNTILPTLQCVVEMGSASLLASNTVAAALFSITKPLVLEERSKC